ncbi:small integral membrane protein 14 [Linepithema humile]|uniref:small integral membrane protein 14 n=1 Tax=Linepithema humile TaxID=83485 RepID=UPI00351EADC7
MSAPSGKPGKRKTARQSRSTTIARLLAHFGRNATEDDNRNGWNSSGVIVAQHPKRFVVPSCRLALRSRNSLFRPSGVSSLRGRFCEKPIKMSDEGFDPCECMWNHLSVQHLLSILRQSQDYCTETECFSVSRIPGPPPNVHSESSDFVFAWFVIAFLVLMYAFRPRSLRQPSRNITKNSNEPDSHDDPSPPTVN